MHSNRMTCLSVHAIKSAYLQGKQHDRIILYRIPKGGIPEEGIYEGGVLAARVPIYGTKDAGRGFWLRLKEVAESKGYVFNKILPTMSARRKDEKVVGVLISNLDDLLYGKLPGHEQAIQEALSVNQISFLGFIRRLVPPYGVAPNQTYDHC